jgi:hypothetical protein
MTLSKTYILYPRVLKGQEKEGELVIGNYRNTLYKDRFICSDIVDGIMKHPQLNFGEILNDHNRTN